MLSPNSSNFNNKMSLIKNNQIDPKKENVKSKRAITNPKN